ncbi:MAG: LPP20 family lipoprotein, partial [Bradymonadaceae bacterium]
MIDRTRHRAPRAVRALGSVIAAILCLAGCASSSGQKKDDSAADRPTWLAEGEHPEYPSHGYVTGLGKAENRQAAYASALSEIAFQIKADIDSSFEMNTSERAVTKGNETTVSRTSDRDEVIELKSQLDTMGLARLVDTYVDDSGVYHVFAALDRSKAHAAFSKRYREKRKKYAKVADNLATSIESANMRVLANHVERLGRASDDLKSTRRIVSALGGG